MNMQDKNRDVSQRVKRATSWQFASENTTTTTKICNQWRLRKEHDKLRKEFPECNSKHPPMCKKAHKEEMVAMLDRVDKEGKHINNPFFDCAFTMDAIEEQAWERYPSARSIQRRRKNTWMSK